MMLRPGVYLQDRYEILEQIGSGGMSVVYKAKCHKLNRLVAIKVLKEEFSTDSNFVAKFKMEAQAAAGLSHPNIVSIYDVIDEGKLHYIVMELIEGITLKSYIAKKGRLEVKESIGIAIQVAQGIAAAHEQHIIHRDIKPQNMIISRDGKVKVADFGIARAVSAQTLSSAAMGSVHYISPEQARGGYSDARSDLYSLGITMYEMVTGRLPFEGENTVSIALAHLEDAMVPPSVYNPEISISLEQIILKCTEKKPERRYASAGDVINDLRKALLNPEGEFVREPMPDSIRDEVRSVNPLEGATVQISDGELSQIKERKRPPAQQEPDREYEREAAATRRPQRQPEPAAPQRTKTKPKPNQKKRQDEDEVNPQIERLLAGAGIVVAIIIVAVVIVVFAKLGGLFQFGSGKKPSTGSTESVVMTTDAAESSSLDSTQVYMPDVVGMADADAEEMLKNNYNLIMTRSYEFFDDVQEGLVARQDPVEGTVVSKGSRVYVVISNGSDKIDLTTLGLETLDGSTARTFLMNKKLLVEIMEEESETVERGKIIRYEPEKVPEGGTVTLYISTGPHVNLVAVPNITGRPEEEAVVMIEAAGLTVGDTTTANHDTVPKGSIISQSGGENGQIEPGGKISYVVSSGPEVSNQRYVASINKTYDASSLIGPGAGSASVTIIVRLHQDGDGGAMKEINENLTQPMTITADTPIPISFTGIESRNGTDQGSIEVVNVDTGDVLKSYPLTFFPMD